MSTTREALDEFYQYAAMRLTASETTIDLDELLHAWYDERDRQQIRAVVTQGLQDIERGCGEPARQFTETLRIRYGLPST